MKKIKIVLILLMIGITIIGCGKKKEVVEENTEVVTQPPVIEEPVEVVETHEDEVLSDLTGDWINKENENKRPYAIVFNNIEYASPQSGIGDAAILYEALVEGGITRLMGIYEDFNLERIGSVRSARHYFVSFADEYDAIFVHYGHTKYATAKIESLGVNNLSGLSGIGTTVFYRDNGIKAPHNAFASTKGILEGTKKLGYRTEHKEDFETGHFNFNKEDTDINTDAVADKITLKYSNITTPYLEYHSDDKLYYRYQYNTPHIDKITGKQLAFKNIIIQLVKEWNIDKNGYQTMDIENSSGTGYYITNGKMKEITWQKNEGTKKMHYYDADGKVLSINPGKTFISVYPNDKVEGLKFTN
ncbi:DUF3048 family protein [Mobilisporobacter senegalensis]|uniref:DUF3048 family protein n=1 Tax=Mobilisporobacter senegalensis TaxID=1329262 RepID=A0A3N1XVW7_9FIRM|nr:DUF3048 domain-containing protein [Mobilisporobacter senegalensis]ROR29322.1 DUF3048 family protein [Mobilisporobacter senegalensis]